MYWSAQNLRQVTGGRWQTAPSITTTLTGVAIDSRTIRKGQVFVAIKGDGFDGHDFVAQAAESGAAMAIVCEDRSYPVSLPVLFVEDTIGTLGTLADTYRNHLRRGSTRVIAVTGSNGKTTTRNLIHTVLSAKYAGTQSPRSFNNHLGVPLTILNASPNDDFIVVEVGSNHPGEIASLARIVSPDAAVITNVGAAHIGHFDSEDAIAREKTALLDSLTANGLALLGGDEPTRSLVEPLIQTLPETIRTIWFGQSESNDLYFPACSTDAMGSTFATGDGLQVKLGLLGRHNVTNALAAVAVGRWFEMDDQTISAALETVRPLPMRLDVKQIGDGSLSLTLINDAYNANPASMARALAVLREYPRPHSEGRRVAILGDMFELGDRGAKEHCRLAHLLDRCYDDEPILAVFIGSLTRHTAEILRDQWPPECVRHFPELDETVTDQIAELLGPSDVVMLKASRGMALERLVPAIERRVANFEEHLIRQ